MSRSRKSQSVTNGFTPGGHIPVGYSYLERAHSLVTPTRKGLPKGMDSPRIGDDSSFDSSPSPSAFLHHSESMPDVRAEAAIVRPMLPSSTSSILMRKNSLDDSLRLSVAADGVAVDLAKLVIHLPSDPKTWTPSQVALYLTQVLGLTPKPIVEDVTAYVRRSRMTGRAFLRLQEKQLVAEGLNVKWRKLMIAAVKKLRRDCIRNRIWGASTVSSLPWATQGDDVTEDDEDETEAAPPPVQPSPAFAKGTLKRLRDKKAVRTMITSFENSNESFASSDADDSSDAVGRLQKRPSLASLPGQSPRLPMPPIYGEGYVRERAASFSSLYNEDAPTLNEGRRGFTREQLEQLFGDLSEAEAEDLANELDADQRLTQQQEQRYIDHDVQRSPSDSSFLSHGSSASSAGDGESAPMTPSVMGGVDLTPLDAETVNLIVEAPSIDNLRALANEQRDMSVQRQPSPPVSSLQYVQSLHKDILVDDESEGVDLGAVAALRPGLGNRSRSNPYRRSTYEPEELEALGLEMGVSTFKFDTAKKIERSDGAAQDSIRIRKGTAQTSTDFRSLFIAPQNDEETHPRRDYSEDSADGVAPLGCSGGNGTINGGRLTGTFGRAALHAALLKAQSDEPADKGKRAEDESEWGVTLSRKQSRRSTLARSVVPPTAVVAAPSPPPTNEEVKEGSAAARMSQLFNPIAPLSTANVQSLADEQPTRDSDEQLLVPLSTLEKDADGNRSLRKTSMVLVDRRRFEALAKRMGVLEEQLAGLEVASLPPDSDLGSLRERSERTTPPRMALDDVFAAAVPASRNDANLGADTHDDDEETKDAREWRLLRSLGAVPSYALGLAAGAGFVLLSEVFGRRR